MKEVQQNYISLRAQNGTYYKARILLAGGRTYGINKIVTRAGEPVLKIDAALFDGSGPQVGNAHSSQCEFVVLEQSAHWPRMAKFEVQVQLCSADGNQQSDWLSMGKFYTDVRSDDSYGHLKIQAFDGMLKLETGWTDIVPGSAEFPMTSRAWANMIQNAGLATFEDLQQLDNSKAFIGLNTATTIRDVLKSIAAANGGNWMMTTDEKLRLVKFRNPVAVTTHATTSDYVWLGKSVSGFNRSPALNPVSGVRLEAEDGTVSIAGNDSQYMLRGSCEFTTNVGPATLALTNTSGYVYRPFDAPKAILDPITELGDIVVIDGQGYQAMRLSWTLGALITADIGADYDEEVDHEYQMLSPQTKTLRKALAATNKVASTVISQTSQQIQLLASSIGDEITNLQNQIDGNIQSWSGNEVPTNDNFPVTSWEDDPSEHVGDVYLVNIDAGIPQAGQYYRFIDNNGVYSWALLSDSALSEALTQAAAALAAAQTAEGVASNAVDEAALKGRIWITQPEYPYSVGDLWFNSTNPGQADILTCINVSPTTTGGFSDGDWQKLNKYIDDSGLATYLQTSPIIQAIENQLDRKAETYYQAADPITSWTDPTTGRPVAFIVGHSVIGVDRVGISGNVSEHASDLWYKTDNHTTWYFDGTQWRQQDVPDDVFDKIDGKAQIFITRPYPPYHEGDLWFDSETSGIMTCVNTRLEGNYVNSDWQERNKYTDDTAANLVKKELTSELNIQAGEISARVTKTGGSSSSFGWSLTSDSHTWYSGSTTVMKVNSSGLEVEGKVTATSGYIGNGSQGFEITSSAIKNGMTSLSDTDHDGVYIGTNGIALGGGKFKVTSGGAVTAKDLTLTGGSISLGDDGTEDHNPVFSVTNQGAVTAKNLTLTGGSISLGDDGTEQHNPVFRVTNAGAVTAKNLTLTGGSINIKKTVDDVQQNVFSVSTNGAINANFENGTLTIGEKMKLTGTGNSSSLVIGGFTIGNGSIYTNGQDDYSDQHPDAGVHLSASGIRLGANFRVNDDGDLYANNAHLSGTLTIGGNAAITQADLYDAIYQSSKNYSKWNSTSTSYGSAITTGSTSYPNYFRAQDITATRYMTATEYYVERDEGNSLQLKGHYHTIDVDNTTGRVTIGAPYNAASAPFFNIADTAYFRNAVSAVEISSFTELAYSPTADKTIRILNSDHTYYASGMLYGRVKATLSNNNEQTILIAIDASEAGGSIGIYTPLNVNNPHESTATDRWFTITSGLNQETVEIYTQYDSQTKTDNVKYSTSTGSYPNATLFSFARKDIGVRQTIRANGTYNAKIDDNLDGYSAVTVDVPTSGGVVTSITRYNGEIGVSSLGNSFDFSDQSGTHTYQFTYDDDSHSYHDITFPDSGGGEGSDEGTLNSVTISSQGYEQLDSGGGYDYTKLWLRFNEVTNTLGNIDVSESWQAGYSQGVTDAGGGGEGEYHEIAYQGGYNSSTHKYYLTVWCRGGGAQVTFYSNSAIT